jgi:hypothetical protein
MKTQDLASADLQKMRHAAERHHHNGKMPAYTTMKGDQMKHRDVFIRSLQR